jgi:hypothetical protein
MVAADSAECLRYGSHCNTWRHHACKAMSSATVAVPSVLMANEQALADAGAPAAVVVSHHAGSHSPTLLNHLYLQPLLSPLVHNPSNPLQHFPSPFSPAATLSCSSTRSTPVMASVTGCSTCSSSSSGGGG